MADYNGLGALPHHVDRKALYTDLEARVRYLQQFIGFTADDVIALNKGSKYIKALAPTLVDRVYSKLLEADITARVFKTRSTTSEEDLDEYPEFKSPYIQCRRMFLRWYITRICSDPTKIEFWAYLDKVGRMHTGKDRMISFDVEYIHIGACLGYIQDVLIEGVMGCEKMSLPFRVALIRALGKVIWIQNDLFARWRCRDGAEFEAEVEAVHRDQNPTTNATNVNANTRDQRDEETSSVRSTSSFRAESASIFSDRQSTARTSISISTQQAATDYPACPFSPDYAPSYETKVWSDTESGRCSR
ncbi:hypothetical protein BO85DRAFT_500176 [Aspergillus piperis CBS 112811]|uniref:Globin-sensor domain-containing protein n=1 Tax=Aspergillus piperis CBS 112811 TaxID=1448313 RepID=A0A8G1QVJ1_9EURO|nr:hypothetical protein BO85DRAFT_500176 [Aspergillus piperis CBS 112811]RAH54347.1 hypothetical protein BO85DRAFT_500176 [Aspergillus piperis CBS 112811]